MASWSDAAPALPSPRPRSRPAPRPAPKRKPQARRGRGRRRRLDRARRGPAGRRRRDERRRPAAERPARQARHPARAPPRREAGARLAAVDGRGLTADPAAGAEAFGLVPANPAETSSCGWGRGRGEREVANRRIRLLLGVFVLAFALTFMRAAWLQGVRASSFGRLASSQHSEDVVIPAARGTIYDRGGVQLAIGEQAQTVYADPRQVKDAQREALVIARTLHLDPVHRLPLAERPHAWLRLRRAQGGSGARREASPEGAPRDQLLRRGAAVLPAVLARLAGARLRGRRQPRPRRARAFARPGACRPARRERIVKDASGQAIDTVVSQTMRDGRDVYLTLDHTIQANAQAVLRDTVLRWHAKSASAIVLDPTTGAVRAMAIAPGFDANVYPRGLARAAAQPRGHRHLRARLDLQARDRRRRALRRASSTPNDALHASLRDPGRRPQDPRRRAARDRDDERLGDPLALVQRRRDHARRAADPAPARPLDLTLRLRAADRDRLPRRERRDRAPEDKWSGSSIGNIPIGQGIAVTPIQMASAYAAIANRGVWVRPHLVDHVGDGDVARARPASDRLGLGRAGDHGDAEERRRRGHRHAGRRARVPGRRQDRDRGKARRARRLLGFALRGLVRRRRAGIAPAAGDPRLGGRAPRRDLGRRRRCACLRTDREVRHAVPRRRRAPGRARRRQPQRPRTPPRFRTTVRPASSPRRSYRRPARVSVSKVSKKCCKDAVLGTSRRAAPAGPVARLAPRWRSTS